MSARVLHFESPAHREMDALLPWYVNATLADDERERVEAHLSECARCQRELDWLRELQCAAAQPAAPAEDRVEASLVRLRRQLGSGIKRRLLLSLRDMREGWRHAPAWTRRALAAQLVLCAGLAGTLTFVRVPAVYHTLGTGSTEEPAEARVVVMFDPSIREDQLRALVKGSGAHIVDGPTDAGAYVLAVPRARVGQALAALRHAHGVQMAERLTPGRD